MQFSRSPIHHLFISSHSTYKTLERKKKLTLAVRPLRSMKNHESLQGAPLAQCISFHLELQEPKHDRAVTEGTSALEQ